MSNMSYCRFENTASDLQDCIDGLQEHGSIDNYLAEMNSSEHEQRAVADLFTKAYTLVKWYGLEAEAMYDIDLGNNDRSV